MAHKNTKKQRIVTLISFAAFIGSGMMGLAKFNQAANSSPTTSEERKISSESISKEQIQGYERVLKREPNNQTALEGLANARVEAKDFKGAIAPLERLVKLYPDRPDYAKQLVEAKHWHGNY